MVRVQRREIEAWGKVNKRILAYSGGKYLTPRHYLKPRLSIKVVVDTSASISTDELEQFYGEIREMAKFSEVEVIEADTEIKKRFKFDPKKPFSIKGRGGTNMARVVEELRKETPDLVIILTDGETPFPAKPQNNEIWVITARGQNPPAGFRAIKMNINARQR